MSEAKILLQEAKEKLDLAINANDPEEAGLRLDIVSHLVNQARELLADEVVNNISKPNDPMLEAIVHVMKRSLR